MKGYLAFWLTLTGSLLVAVAAFNLVIDPYGLFRIVDMPGFNSAKPMTGTRREMVKANQVLRINPRGLILGNSRAEAGFDPEYLAWPAHARPVFSLTFPGTGTETTLRYLQHALANTEGGPRAKPEVVVWGIDFLDFLVDAAVPVRGTVKTREDRRLLTNPDGSKNPMRVVQQAADYAESTFTHGALWDSVQTLIHQRESDAVSITPHGFNPMLDHVKIATDEGYWALFRQKDLMYINANLHRPKDLFDADGRSSPALDDLRQILNLCRRNDIVLHIVIYPYHAHTLEIFRIAGLWPAFEAWKRIIVQIVGAPNSGANGARSVSLWDFSGFNEFSTEAVPTKGDRQTVMRWYWEAGHFKRELGEVTLDRIFERTRTATQFGTLLRPDNVEEQIAAVRAQEAVYRRTHLQEVAELERIAAEIGIQQKKKR